MRMLHAVCRMLHAARALQRSARVPEHEPLPGTRLPAAYRAAPLPSFTHVKIGALPLTADSATYSVPTVATAASVRQSVLCAVVGYRQRRLYSALRLGFNSTVSTPTTMSRVGPSRHESRFSPSP